jgi:hypothetical protein
MDSQNTIYVVLLSSTTAISISILISWYRLRYFKGPLLASLSHLWMAKAVVSGQMNMAYTAVNDKYGEY